jgi:hypothetical protein
MGCFDAGFGTPISVRGSLKKNRLSAGLSANPRTGRELAHRVSCIWLMLLSLRVRGWSLAYFANWACISSSREDRHTVGGGPANYAPDRQRRVGAVRADMAMSFNLQNASF